MALRTKCSFHSEHKHHEDSDEFGDIMQKERCGGEKEWLQGEPPRKFIRGINGIFFGKTIRVERPVAGMIADGLNVGYESKNCI
jgi:hypothetical protein